ncbi:MAG: thiamine diphosphokinase [Thermovirgaceae bacterium]|nr:thiamine diphosphokinase [Thermovirgaceae bacterium]
MSRIIELPQLTARISPGSGSPSLVLVAGGRVPDPNWLAGLCEGRTAWAIDSGIDACRNAGVVPSLFIGDRDSASINGINWARNKEVPSLVFPPEKDLTDLQLALRSMTDLTTGTAAILTGAFGGRYDHSIANLFSMIWAEDEWGVQIRCAADERESFFLLRDRESASFSGIPAGTLISTLSLSEKCTGVNLWGAKWPIGKGTLYARRPFAVSNMVTGANPGLSIEDGEISFGVEISTGWLGVYIAGSGAEEKGWI